MTGTGVQTGTSFPLDEISRVSAFEHQETSPDNPASSGPANSADIRFLGIRSTFPAVNSIANTTLVFAYAAYGPWRTPNDLIVNIFIDADRDGADDFWVLNISTTNPQGGRSDLFLSAVQTLWTGATSTQAPLNAFSASQLNTVPYHTNVMFIPVRASAIGLTETNTSFNYRVTTQIGRVEVDRSQSHFYDAARPGVHFGATLIFFDRPGDLIPVTFNRTNFRAAGSSGILLLHHHNRPEESAQVVLVAP
jgi:hypothetical protein